jgi:hypothetical protein
VVPTDHNSVATRSAGAASEKCIPSGKPCTLELPSKSGPRSGIGAKGLPDNDTRACVMIMRLLNELYRGEHASIPVDGSPEQAARLLRERTRRWRGLTFMDTVVGSVAVNHVVLHRSHRSFQNAFSSIFRGRFIAVRGRTYLTGTFALRRAAQAFMTAWFCFIAVFCLMAVVAGASASSKRGAPFLAGIVAAALFVLSGLALGLLGFAGVRLEKRLSRTDIDHIVEHVKSTFAENVV